MMVVEGVSPGKKTKPLPPEATTRTRSLVPGTGVVVVTAPAVRCSNVAPVNKFVNTTLVHFEDRGNLVLVISQRRQLPADDGFGSVEPLLMVQGSVILISEPDLTCESPRGALILPSPQG